MHDRPAIEKGPDGYLKLPSPSNYLTTREAAAFLRLSKSFLDKARLYGGGPRFQRFGRKILYRHADLDDWARQHRYGSTSEYVDP